ncbi:hypothetical protein E0U59_20820 [Salmonella enterica subsp. enterica serovar Haga]|nr:hypothetical protein [Salmonella enterica subsp. enterica serovar Haga]
MEKEIYQYLLAHKEYQKEWSTREIADLFNMNAYMARHYLMILCNKELLCRSKMQRGARVHWKVSEHHKA